MQHAATAGWSSPGTIVALALGALFLFVTSRRRSPAQPLVPTSVSRLFTFRLGTTEATLSNWGSGVVMVLVPASLELVRHASVLDTGLLFLGFSIPFAVGGGLSGPFARTRGGPTTLAFGMFLLALGMVALALVGPDGATALVIGTLAVAGFGNGIVYSASTSYALVEVAPDDAGEASAVLSMLRVLGLALAVALSTSLMTTIDDAFPGGTWGLRIALVVAAAISAAGIPLTRRSPTGVETPR
jgi:MFS family permease